MKLLVILLLVGCASATLKEAFERESRDAINDFMAGMEKATPLHVALGIEDSDDVQRVERGLKEDLSEYIKKAFKEALDKVTEAVDKGKKINERALDMLKDLHEKMKELEITSEELEEGIEKLKERVDDHLRQILEKMGLFGKRSAVFESEENVVGDLNLRNILLKLKQLIRDKMDAGTVRASLAKVIGQGTQRLCEWLTSKGKEKVLNFFDRLLDDDDDDKRKRAAEDRTKEIKDYLENLEEDVEIKLKRFRNWLNDLIRTGLTKSEDRMQNIREILKKIITQSKDLSKKGLADVLEYLRKYEKEFGLFYEDLRTIILEKLKMKE